MKDLFRRVRASWNISRHLHQYTLLLLTQPKFKDINLKKWHKMLRTDKYNDSEISNYRFIRFYTAFRLFKGMTKMADELPQNGMIGDPDNGAVINLVCAPVTTPGISPSTKSILDASRVDCKRASKGGSDVEARLAAHKRRFGQPPKRDDIFGPNGFKE